MQSFLVSAFLSYQQCWRKTATETNIRSSFRVLDTSSTGMAAGAVFGRGNFNKRGAAESEGCTSFDVFAFDILRAFNVLVAVVHKVLVLQPVDVPIDGFFFVAIVGLFSRQCWHFWKIVSFMLLLLSLFLTPRCIALYVLVKFRVSVFWLVLFSLTSFELFVRVFSSRTFAICHWIFSFVSDWISELAIMMHFVVWWPASRLPPWRLHCFQTLLFRCLRFVLAVSVSIVVEVRALVNSVSTGSLVCLLHLQGSSRLPFFSSCRVCGVLFFVLVTLLHCYLFFPLVGFYLSFSMLPVCSF